MTMKYKSFTGQFKEDGEGGVVVGYASTFDREPDSYGDVVAKGAFSNSLKEWEESGNPIPLLFGHRFDDPFMNIGACVSAAEDERGLKIEARFDDENETAQYCRKLAKEGRLTKFSFAFDILDQGETELDDGTKCNELRELKIYEVSLVPIPANPHATVEDIKSAPAPIKEVFVDVIPRLKAGRVLSKSNEDKLREAAGLIEEVLSQLESQDGGGEGDNGDDGKGGGDASAKAGAKGARSAEILERIDEIIGQ